MLSEIDGRQLLEQPVRGAIAPTEAFRAAVQAGKVGPAHGIPHVSVDLIRKYLADLRRLGLV